MPHNKNKSHPFLSPFPVVCAHRGDSAHNPENTLPAFMSAAELGVDRSESDVHLTPDEQCLSWHDSTLDRMSNGTGNISDYTLIELKQLDAAYSFTPPGDSGYPFRGRGITIPSLAETLEALPDMRFNLDLKGTSLRLAKRFVEVVEQFHAHERILGASFHYRQLHRLRRMAPSLVTSFSSPEARTLIGLHKAGLLKHIFPFKGLTLQVPEIHGNVRIVTTDLIKLLHEKGISIQVWTINAEPDMQRLLDMGVDGILTDDPRLLQKVLRERE